MMSYERALQEIQRVACRYVLVGVPFMENLASVSRSVPRVITSTTLTITRELMAQSN